MDRGGEVKAAPGRVANRGNWLRAGHDTIVIGGNPRTLGDPSAYPPHDCDPVDLICYHYTGFHGYRATIETK